MLYYPFRDLFKGITTAMDARITRILDDKNVVDIKYKFPNEDDELTAENVPLSQVIKDIDGGKKSRKHIKSKKSLKHKKFSKKSKSKRIRKSRKIRSKRNKRKSRH